MKIYIKKWQLLPRVILLLMPLSFWAKPMEWIPIPDTKAEAVAESTEASCSYTRGITRYYGQRDWEVPHYYSSNQNRFILRDDCRNIRTVDVENYDGSRSVDADWFAPIEKDPFSAHWGAKVTHDFFNYKLGRNGHFGNGELLLVNVHRDLIGFNEALWCDPQDFSINVSAPEKANLENIGHEYTHGILWAAKWSYASVPISLWTVSEARSITEGLCNIMGNEVENFAYESSTITPHPNMETDFGIDDNENGTFYPDFTNNTNNYASYYKGINWKPNLTWWQDEMMYKRSNVISHLFYLLADPNNKYNYQNPDNPNPVVIPLILPLDGTNSRHQATLLFYLTAMNYIEEDWTYKDFAFALIEQSKTMYGLCSAQTKNVFTALYAVGLAESPLVIDFCEVSTPYKDRNFYSPHSISLGQDCDLNYFTGISSAPITLNFYAGDFFIEGDVTFSGSGTVIFDKNLCSGSNPPQPPSGNAHTIVLETNNASIREKIEPGKSALQTSLEIFPNPFSQNFIVNIDIPDGKTTGDLMLYNQLGQLVRQKKYANLSGNIQEEWDTSSLPPAIYLVRWIQGSETITRQIIKQ